MFRKNIFYENATSNDNMILRALRVFKREVGSLVKKFKKDSVFIYGCNQESVCYLYVTYSKISDVLTLSLSSCKESCHEVCSVFGFKYRAESKEYVHSSPIDLNGSIDAWCNKYFDDISNGTFRICGDVK